MTRLIAATTAVIAVKATDGRCDGSNHIWAKLGNGVVSDVSWKCTNDVQDDDDWTKADFDDSAWSLAVESSRYDETSVIWTDCSCTQSSYCHVAYCRKVIQNVDSDDD